MIIHMTMHPCDITIRPAASIKDNNTLFRVPARLDPDTEDLFLPGF